MATSLLALDGVNSFYGDSHVLHDVAFQVQEGRLLALLGRNGAGKTTCISTIIGFLTARTGDITFAGKPIAHLVPEKISRAGIGLVPQGRRIFPTLTVRENLDVAARAAAPDSKRKWDRDAVCAMFPRLQERQGQVAGSLSGGEQQMLALGRALMLAPKILLVDEPSVGLAPLLVARTIDAIKELKEKYHLTVLMAEQNFTQAVRIADRGYVIVHGKIAVEGRSADELNNNDLIKKFYLGL